MTTDEPTTKILLTGQCTLHWGRMEFGNIGNYYVLEPLVRGIHAAVPNAVIETTFQLSKRFCDKENVRCIPMDLYYGWTGNDLNNAEDELTQAENTESNSNQGTYLRAVSEADLVVDYSGDMWGANADFLGPSRFKVGLLRDRIPQVLGKPTAMLAGSPGPFPHTEDLALAQLTYSNFDLVTIREPCSREVLSTAGFDTTRTFDAACPAWLFEPAADDHSQELLRKAKRLADGRKLVAVMLCGWNFPKGPFDRWPRKADEFQNFAKLIRHLSLERDCLPVLISHSNGFDPKATDFSLTHGRDFPIMQALAQTAQHQTPDIPLMLIEQVLEPWQTKYILGACDFVVSGRIHGAVAALSQSVPTMIIDYGHEPKAHKVRGFADICGMQEHIVTPTEDLTAGFDRLLGQSAAITKHLQKDIPRVKKLAKKSFEMLTALCEQQTTLK
ncbi:MAG: polysaccharide pyruvyl transferase family protein [Fuerstiella sp.]